MSHSLHAQFHSQLYLFLSNFVERITFPVSAHGFSWVSLGCAFGTDPFSPQRSMRGAGFQSQGRGGLAWLWQVGSWPCLRLLFTIFFFF